MRYLPKSERDRKEMLAALGAASIGELFGCIPAASRMSRPLDLPAALAEAENLDLLPPRAAPAGGRPPPPAPPRAAAAPSPPVPPGGGGRPALPRRVLHRLHALSSGDFPGDAPGHLRVPDDDVPAYRAGSRQRLDVRRLDRAARGGDDGAARDRPAPRGGGAQYPPRIPRSAPHLRPQPGA